MVISKGFFLLAEHVSSELVCENDGRKLAVLISLPVFVFPFNQLLQVIFVVLSDEGVNLRG